MGLTKLRFMPTITSKKIIIELNFILDCIYIFHLTVFLSTYMFMNYWLEFISCHCTNICATELVHAVYIIFTSISNQQKKIWATYTDWNHFFSWRNGSIIWNTRANLCLLTETKFQSLFSRFFPRKNGQIKSFKIKHLIGCGPSGSMFSSGRDCEFVCFTPSKHRGK